MHRHASQLSGTATLPTSLGQMAGTYSICLAIKLFWFQQPVAEASESSIHNSRNEIGLGLCTQHQAASCILPASNLPSFVDDHVSHSMNTTLEVECIPGVEYGASSEYCSTCARHMISFQTLSCRCCQVRILRSPVFSELACLAYSGGNDGPITAMPFLSSEFRRNNCRCSAGPSPSCSRV